VAIDFGDELLCIVFTDIVGWTALGERVGDEAADQVRRGHFAAVREALKSHRGREIKTAGDSVMATFRSALDALRCASEIRDMAESMSVQVRVGLHAGEPIADGDDLFGTAVNVASRLCSAAGAGEVLLSDLVHSLVGRRGDLELEDAGLLTLKGIQKPVRAFRLRGAHNASSSEPRAVGAPKAHEHRTPLRAERTLLCPELVERDRELGLLTAALDDTAAGRGGVTLLVGEAGVGKTRLTREICELARRRGTVVLTGRAVPSQSPVPYRSLTEAFLGAFRTSGPPTTPELAGFGRQLGRLVPDWRVDTPGGADESPILLGEAVVRLLHIVGEGAGCVLVLEDLHWADAETLAVVEYLADALGDQPVLCLCTARPEGDAVDTVARLRRHGDAAVVGLSKLTPAGIERAVAACLDTEHAPPDLRSCIESNSEGNPFLIEELLAGLVASGALLFQDGAWTTTGLLVPSVPFDFATSLERRLAALDGTARQVLRAAALLGRRFDWELLPGVAEVDGRAVVDALRLAVDEQVIEVDGDGFRFRHALTREAVLHELLPPERRALARRAWPAVERAHAGLPGSWCELAADLAEAAGEPVAAARHLVESARRALEDGALASGEATATRARELGATDPDVLDEVDEVLVQILALAGKPERAAVVGDPLVARLAGRSAAGERQAVVLLVLARAALTGGNAHRARGLIDQAQDFLTPGAGRDQVAAQIEAVAAHVALEQVRLADAGDLASAAFEHARATGQPAVMCEALEVLGRVRRTSGEGDWRGAFQDAAELAEQHGLTTWHLRARHELALMAAYTEGDVGPLAETRHLAAQHGALITVAVMDLALSEIALSRFDREACLEHAKRCVAASRQFRLATLPVANLWLAGGHALAGDNAAMEAAIADALAPDPDDPRILGDLWGRVRATHSMVLDDRDALRRDLDTMMTYVRVAPITTSIFGNRMIWAILRAIDDDDHGAAARAELASATHLSMWRVFALVLALIDTIALGREGRVDDANAAFAHPVQLLLAEFGGHGPIRYGLVLTAEAAIRDGWGEPVAWLREAEAFFTDGGYDRIARRCRSLLAAAGAPVPRRGRGESVVPPRLRAIGVTSRELDVLLLVTEGLSNPEIAKRLVLSPRTVERHMSNLFDRTGVRERSRLAEVARDLLT
jgi:class 3 adenylate cyclase/DNA-binding CsgD family transcriptional regulator